ncbi:1e259956-c79d-4fdf-bedf-fc6b26aaa6b0 [Sclerotinia trifoliorum]|uniref:1e259956-c79d-4fdf-bedf-fc6b26aaa6b0 n=1 Tax=Sclerotinia trifoliorum TaxID=28548 RepID=A0A8H2VN25_9HELO|nr:1e259956-c79d-4fdf-bedf-fc6b26aaa6b0 [Sclerotinia trifoliorum]
MDKMRKTKYADRSIPKISLHDFEERMGVITEELMHAAETDGFFVLINHGIDLSTISHMFSTSEKFFSLPTETKSLIPFSPIHNIGWETNSQVRPSTGVADKKESYQLQFNPTMSDYWLPESLLPGFQNDVRGFMSACQELSVKLMRCFERGLGVDEGLFVRAHDIGRRESQTVLRLLHYFAVGGEVGKRNGKDGVGDGEWIRAGPHVDWSFLTLLFQREGQAGLEICPGKEVQSEFGWEDKWTKILPREGEVVVNIGDCAMWWSGGRCRSTWHRVVTPRGRCQRDGENRGRGNNAEDDEDTEVMVMERSVIGIVLLLIIRVKMWLGKDENGLDRDYGEGVWRGQWRKFSEVRKS